MEKKKDNGVKKRRIGIDCEWSIRDLCLVLDSAFATVRRHAAAQRPGGETSACKVSDIGHVVKEQNLLC